MSDWKPIETAPKDGTCILVYPAFGPGQEVCMVEWVTMKRTPSRWQWNTLPIPKEPTHWMPLPEPPNA